MNQFWGNGDIKEFLFIDFKLEKHKVAHPDGTLFFLIREGVLGAGPNFEYLVAKKVSIKDKSRFQKRSMILQVERARASGLG